MAKESFVVTENVYHAEVTKLDSSDHSFAIEFFGFSTTGEKRKVRIKLKPWMLQYLARELWAIPKSIRAVADEMEKALKGDGQ